MNVKYLEKIRETGLKEVESGWIAGGAAAVIRTERLSIPAASARLILQIILIWTRKLSSAFSLCQSL